MKTEILQPVGIEQESKTMLDLVVKHREDKAEERRLALIKIEQESEAMLEYVNTITIETGEDYVFWVGHEGKNVKDLERKIIGYYAEDKDITYKDWKAVCSAEAKHLEPIVLMTKSISDEAKKYQFKQDEKNRKLLADARAVAEKEAEERRMAELLRAEKSGNQAQIEQLLSAPIRVMVPVVAQVVTPKIDGYSTRKNWKARLIEGQEHLVPREYCSPDMKKLNAMAKAHESAFNVPGAEAYNDQSSSYRK